MTNPLPPLHRGYVNILVNLFEAGGAADLDIHGRVVTGPTRHPLPGDTISWLVLVSRGLVAGERGRILLTEEGREIAQGVVNGRVREST